MIPPSTWTNTPPVRYQTSLGTLLFAIGLFFFLLVIYHANGTFLFNVDTEVNAQNAVLLAERHQLLFTPTLSPEYYTWAVLGPNGSIPVSIAAMDPAIQELKEEGHLRVTGETYVIRATRFPERSINTFGWAVATVSAPIFAFLDPWLSNPQTRREWIWRGGKLSASIFVAASAVCVFLTARLYASALTSAMVVVAYGLGTSVWSVSSQSLWPHGPSEFFLALGTYGLARSRDSEIFAALCGFAYASATCCRQPGAMAVLAAGFFYLATNRRALIWYVAAGLPLAFAMFGINAWCYGSPFHFGELLVPQLAEETTGSPDIWQTPLLLGLGGLLISPSRGLFIYSPFLLFSLWGIIRVWRDRSFAELRPLTVAIAAMWLVHARYFDWWGGWSYGYRHIVDSATLLCVLLIPIVSRIAASRWRVAVFVVLLGWSIAVQALGAWAFDISGWNGRSMIVRTDSSGKERFIRFATPVEAHNKDQLAEGETVVSLDIDRPSQRHRLWSWTDHQIAYYFFHFRESVDTRRQANLHLSRSIDQRIHETRAELSRALTLVGEPELATRFGTDLSKH